eukprot:TRINITY_DN13052_c0_g1_i1.p1 TRINITY_DN13052_c0_g1~~TRINITY_DN13052_c0_g1_i1.p1  ORF type:complete len:895 (-),score=189.98 TRINITY_DN13052_c0_g1_i1:426-3110(-)
MQKYRWDAGASQAFVPQDWAQGGGGGPPILARGGASSIMVPTGEVGGVSLEFLEQLKKHLRQADDGATKQPCTKGWSCNRVDCWKMHEESREITENPLSVICKFHRQCLRHGCWKYHIYGRQVDESREICIHGKLCSNMICGMHHNEPRVPVVPMRCYQCHEVGHVKSECPHNLGPYPPGTYVKLTNFGLQFRRCGPDAMLPLLQRALEEFGQLAIPPEYYGDGQQVRAAFLQEADADKAIAALPGRVFNVEKIDIPPHRQGASPPTNRAASTLFVGNLPFEATEGDIREMFASLCEVKDVRMPSAASDSRWYAFVELYPGTDMAAMAKAVNGSRLHGRRIKVSADDIDFEDAAFVLLGFPRNWQELELQDFMDNLNVTGRHTARVLTEDAETVGRARIGFRNIKDAKRCHEVLKDQQVAGVSLQIQWEDEQRVMAEEAASRKPARHEKPGAHDKRIFVGGLSAATTKEDLEDFFEQCGTIDRISIPPSKVWKSKCVAFIEFRSEAAARNAIKTFDGDELLGMKMRVAWAQDGKESTAAFAEGDEMAPGNDNRNDRKWRDRCDKDEVAKLVHLDELELANRPDVQPAKTDTEVWVDILPADAEMGDWKEAFGECSEVFRLTDSEDSPISRGYVRFASHEAAAKCVASGQARWSESERVIASQARDEDRKPSDRPTYSRSVVALIIGPKGSFINTTKSDLKLAQLSLRGDGLQHGKESEFESKRLHFFCRGKPEALEGIYAALNDLVENAYTKLSEALERDATKGEAEEEDAKESRKEKRRRRRRDDEDLPPAGWPLPGWPPPPGYGMPPFGMPPPGMHLPPGMGPPPGHFGFMPPGVPPPSSAGSAWVQSAAPSQAPSPSQAPARGKAGGAKRPRGEAPPAWFQHYNLGPPRMR